jgi:hypothetical protein
LCVNHPQRRLNAAWRKKITAIKYTNMLPHVGIVAGRNMGSKNKAELEAELKALRFARRSEGWVSVSNNFIRWGGLVSIARYSYLSVDSLAGLGHHCQFLDEFPGECGGIGSAVVASGGRWDSLWGLAKAFETGHSGAPTSKKSAIRKADR